MKKILISCLIACMMVFALGGLALADTPTVTTVTWNGGGIVTGVVTNGSASTTTFYVGSNGSTGTFTNTDSNDNPYGYAVDSTSSYMNGTFTGGGVMTFQTNRTGSYTPMYGVAGQSVYAGVQSDTGSGAIATGSSTNYAAMGNGTYGQPHTAGGYNFEAVAGSTGSYQITQTISSSAAIASFLSTGTGTSKINDMTTGASGATNVNLGWGGGCYTNANGVFTGAGTFRADATGSNSITTPIAGASGAMVAGGWAGTGNGTYGSVSLSTIMNFNNGASVGNYSIKVN